MSTFSRRQFLRQAGAAGTAALAGSLWRGTSSADAAARPNVLFILSDDLGWGDLGCYGSNIAKTPNLDRFAAEGLRFTSFYTNAPVCSPTRAAFTTGLFPSRLRVHSHFASAEQNEKRGMPQAMSPGVITVADLFQQAGYVTGHFGKWHMGNIEPKEYGVAESRIVAGGGSFGGPAPGWSSKTDFYRRSSEYIVDAAIGFLEAHRGEPFYLNVWTTQPHAPLDPSEEHMKPFARFNDKRLQGTFTTPFGVFYGSVGEMDRHIGRLLDKLDELGLRNNTLVVFSSDNGPEDIHLSESAHSGAGHTGPFRGRKRSLYEGGIRTPFIVRWPGHVPAGLVDNATVLSGVDFLPSAARLAGLDTPPKLDGEDMSAAWLGTPREREKTLLWERRFRVIGDPINRSPMMAIRKGKWKLLMNLDKSRVELYDIPQDPSETDNQAARHGHLVKKLAKELMAWHGELPASPIEPDAGSNAYPWPE